MKIKKSELRKIIQEEVTRLDEIGPLALPLTGKAAGAIATLGGLAASAVAGYRAAERMGVDEDPSADPQIEFNEGVVKAIEAIGNEINSIKIALEDIQFPTSDNT